MPRFKDGRYFMICFLHKPSRQRSRKRLHKYNTANGSYFYQISLKLLKTNLFQHSGIGQSNKCNNKVNTDRKRVRDINIVKISVLNVTNN